MTPRWSHWPRSLRPTGLKGSLIPKEKKKMWEKTLMEYIAQTGKKNFLQLKMMNANLTYYRRWTGTFPITVEIVQCQCQGKESGLQVEGWLKEDGRRRAWGKTSGGDDSQNHRHIKAQMICLGQWLWFGCTKRGRGDCRQEEEAREDDQQQQSEAGEWLWRTGEWRARGLRPEKWCGWGGKRAMGPQIYPEGKEGQKIGRYFLFIFISTS